MYQLMSLPLAAESLGEYESWRDLRQELHGLGCQGVEAIWGGEPIPEDFPRDLAIGYHLTFYPDWLDFYREDRRALEQKFGSLETVEAFFGGWGADRLLSVYREDLARARSLGARYVVFHVSDVSIEEGYTYRWLHSNREVMGAAAEIINQLLEDGGAGPEFLVENQWWPGFTMTDPEETAWLLEAIACPQKGIMLDTGHLMNANPDLETQGEGAAYIRSLLQRHGSLCRYIRGVHLHQSLSGAYVRAHGGRLPEESPADYWERFRASYQHVLAIDQHMPWTAPEVGRLVADIAPHYLVHELTGRSRTGRRQAVGTQRSALGGVL